VEEFCDVVDAGGEKDGGGDCADGAETDVFPVVDAKDEAD